MSGSSGRPLCRVEIVHAIFLMLPFRGQIGARIMSGGAKEGPLAVDAVNRRHLDTLYREEAPRLRSYLRRKIGDSEVANDLVQESFVQIAQVTYLSQLANPAAYLQRIARNLWFGRFRGPRRVFENHQSGMDEGLEIAVPPTQEHQLAADQLLELYERAVATMPAKTRNIFLMSRRDGMTYREIQKAVSLSLGAVEYHMMRAIAHVDHFLDENDHDAR